MEISLYARWTLYMAYWLIERWNRRLMKRRNKDWRREWGRKLNNEGWYKDRVWLVKINRTMNGERWTQTSYRSKEKEKEWSKDDRTNRGDRSDCGGWMTRKIEERESLRWEVTYKRTKNLVIEGEVGGRMNTGEVEVERDRGTCVKRGDLNTWTIKNQLWASWVNLILSKKIL